MQSNQVIDVLSTRLKLGGQWFYPGDSVLLDKADADVYRSRGLSSPAPAGTIPKNVEKIHASKIGLVTKADEVVEKEEKSVYLHQPDAGAPDVDKPATSTSMGGRNGKRAR